MDSRNARAIKDGSENLIRRHKTNATAVKGLGAALVIRPQKHVFRGSSTPVVLLRRTSFRGFYYAPGPFSGAWHARPYYIVGHCRVCEVCVCVANPPSLCLYFFGKPITPSQFLEKGRRKRQTVATLSSPPSSSRGRRPLLLRT